MFDVEGEQGFRLREIHMIDELTRLSPVVVATGGGCGCCAKRIAAHFASVARWFIC
ncbi:shikimate kinase [Vreelandella titanicae]|uniref:shikimate kinase n=1 Tax=Vreelandella titanicae TaxID=664683 RepID=UPI003D2B0AA8